MMEGLLGNTATGGPPDVEPEQQADEAIPPSEEGAVWRDYQPHRVEVLRLRVILGLVGAGAALAGTIAPRQGIKPYLPALWPIVAVLAGTVCFSIGRLARGDLTLIRQGEIGRDVEKGTEEVRYG